MVEAVSGSGPGPPSACQQGGVLMGCQHQAPPRRARVEVAPCPTRIRHIDKAGLPRSYRPAFTAH